MSGINVGSVSVEVVPSAEQFVPRLRSQLSGAQVVGDELGRQIGSRVTAQIADAIAKGVTDGAGRARAQSAAAGQSSGGAFADGFKARVEAALRDLPKPKVGVDATELDAELADIRARLAALGDTRVGVDLSAEEALAELDRLKARLDELGARSPDINVRVDAARAVAELEAVKAEVDALDGDTATIDVDTSGAMQGVSGLAAAVLGLGPALIPVGAAATAGLAGIATAALAGAAGVGVLALAFSGVSKAVQLMGQEQQAAAADAARTAATAATTAAQEASAANQLRSAQASLANARANAADQAVTAAERVKNAEQTLATTEATVAQQRVTAARRVQQAEESLTLANQRAADAQKALNDAREQAARDLEDSANRQADAQLNAQQAALDLQAAQQHLAEVQSSSTATDLDKRQAALSVVEAQQRLSEAQLEAARATEDNTKAQQAGVDGAPAVVSAQQQLTQALQQQQQAAQSLADARAAQQQQEIDGTVRVAAAQQAVADAERAQAVQQRQSAFAVAQAQQQVQNAMLAVQRAAHGAGTAGVSSLARIHEQLAAMPAATIALATLWERRILPMFNRLKDAAAGGLLPGITAGLHALAPAMGPLLDFVGRLAADMGRLFDAGAKALTAPFWTQFFGWVSSIAGPVLETMARTLGAMAQGFAGLLQAFAPVSLALGQGIQHLAERFAAWASSLSSNASFQRFLDYILANGPMVAKVFGDLVVVGARLLEDLAPLGAAMLPVIDAVAKFLASIPPDALLAIAGAIGAVVFIIAGPTSGLIVAIVALAAIVARHFPEIVDAVRTAWDAVIGFFSGAWDYIKNVWSAMWSGTYDYVLKPIGDAAAAIDRFFGPTGPIRGAFNAVWAWIRDTWSATWSGVERYIGKPINDAVDTVTGLFGARGPIRGAFNDVWDWIKNTWSTIWNGLTALVTDPIDTARNVISSILGAEKNGLQTIFRGAVSAIGAIWGGLKDLFKAPITFMVRTVLDDGLIGAWNTLVGWIPFVGKDLKIPDIPLPKGWAGGGVIPGYSPGRDSVLAMLSPGEGVLRPEVVRALGPDTIHGLNRAAIAGALPHFDSGGILGDITGGIKSVAGDIWGGLKGIAKVALGDPVKWLTGMFAGPLGKLGRIENSKFGAIIGAIPRAAARELLDHVLAIIGLGGASGPSSNLGSGFAAAGNAGAVLLGRSMAAARGWDGAQWNALDLLWNRESGWRWDATNPTSGAYGIPQSLPAAKMAAAGPDWRTNPATQIAWGLDYIGGRYGSPAAAWAHELNVGWYDQGGPLHPGLTLAYNGTGTDEWVSRSPSQPAAAARPALVLTGPLVNVEGNLDSVTLPQVAAAVEAGLSRFEQRTIADVHAGAGQL